MDAWEVGEVERVKVALCFAVLYLHDVERRTVEPNRTEPNQVAVRLHKYLCFAASPVTLTISRNQAAPLASLELELELDVPGVASWEGSR